MRSHTLFVHGHVVETCKIGVEAQQAEYHKAYLERNKDKIAANSKAYYERNKDKFAANSKAYRERNKDRLKFEIERLKTVQTV